MSILNVRVMLFLIGALVFAFVTPGTRLAGSYLCRRANVARTTAGRSYRPARS